LRTKRIGRGYRVALIEPMLGKNKAKFCFRKDKQARWFAVGICSRKIMIEKNFKFDPQDKNHGFYGVSNEGKFYSSCDSSLNHKEGAFNWG